MSARDVDDIDIAGIFGGLMAADITAPGVQMMAAASTSSL